MHCATERTLYTHCPRPMQMMTIVWPPPSPPSSPQPPRTPYDQVVDVVVAFTDPTKHLQCSAGENGQCQGDMPAGGDERGHTCRTIPSHFPHTLAVLTWTYSRTFPTLHHHRHPHILHTLAVLTWTYSRLFAMATSTTAAFWLPGELLMYRTAVHAMAGGTPYNGLGCTTVPFSGRSMLCISSALCVLTT